MSSPARRTLPSRRSLAGHPLNTKHHQERTRVKSQSQVGAKVSPPYQPLGKCRVTVNLPKISNCKMRQRARKLQLRAASQVRMLCRTRRRTNPPRKQYARSWPTLRILARSLQVCIARHVPQMIPDLVTRQKTVPSPLPPLVRMELRDLLLGRRLLRRTRLVMSTEPPPSKQSQTIQCRPNEVRSLT